jgi:putative transposase
VNTGNSHNGGHPKREAPRGWLHKTMNILNAMPKSVQPRAKDHLHGIWQAETRRQAEAAFDFFIETYGVKYDKDAAKDRDVLLTIYDFPTKTILFVSYI